MQDDGAWFAAKRYGYGAGRPVAWQGWALSAAHAALIVMGAYGLQAKPAALAAWVVGFAILPLPLYAFKTRGGWRWRWGGED